MTEKIYTTDTPLTIPFHDVDSLNIVWHGRYVKYFELARCELLTLIDYDYNQMRESGYAWPVVDMRIKYVRPITFGQKIKVVATLAEWENRLKIKYVIYDATTAEKLTTGHTIQVAMDINAQEMLFESPDILLEKIGYKS